MMPTIKVLYSERMVADAKGYSPSVAKPREVVASWRRLGVPIQLVEPEPVTGGQFCLAHDEGFVTLVLAGKARNGFGNTSAAIAASLPYTSGAMLSAAREAIGNRKVAVAPCSGFHHARFDAASAFCTFNGLMIAAQVLHTEGVAKRVGILDFDQHYGDGTDDIIQELGVRYVEHYTAGQHWGHVEEAGRFLAAIPKIVARMRDCDVILYQAGADPHRNDPLGGWLTTGQLAERDRRVFEAADAHGVPVAWNLAGGYQTPLRKVLDIHDNTMRACWDVYGASARGENPV